ncbi:MAG TPA: patatin-like phospholipase family protein [Caldimonas sp.]|nr:patatin-like phospholipase family protein [Caldimonas sp.]
MFRPAAGTVKPEGGVPRRINLALQGGGAHGAFTWGVLDALLEHRDLEFEGLSGSSAGAMNAVVFADGWLKGGRSGARESLTAFWTEVGQQVSPAMVTSGDEQTISLSPTGKMWATWAALFSPTQLNPLGVDPLRHILERHVDFAALRERSPFKLFVGATQVTTGKLRVFRESEISADVLLASACLPKIHAPVEIDGEPYWDGGYSANPAVFPLFYDCESADVLLVLLTPLARESAPSSVREIDERIAELSFSATFMREMQSFARAAEFAARSVSAAGSLEHKLRTARFHMIDATGVEGLARADTKALAHGPFLKMLHAKGQERAQDWLQNSADQVGERGTVELGRLFG